MEERDVLARDGGQGMVGEGGMTGRGTGRQETTLAKEQGKARSPEEVAAGMEGGT